MKSSLTTEGEDESEGKRESEGEGKWRIDGWVSTPLSFSQKGKVKQKSMVKRRGDQIKWTHSDKHVFSSTMFVTKVSNMEERKRTDVRGRAIAKKWDEMGESETTDLPALEKLIRFWTVWVRIQTQVKMGDFSSSFLIFRCECLLFMHIFSSLKNWRKKKSCDHTKERIGVNEINSRILRPGIDTFQWTSVVFWTVL